MDKMNREIASLTKVMTFFTALGVAKKLEIRLTDEVRVLKASTKIGGTKARLVAGDRLTLLELFHGLMLPSGNDAGLLIATYMGSKLISEGKAKKPEELISSKSMF